MDNTTAKVSCFARAYHFENNKTHIFADSMAARLLGDDYDHIAESMMQGINFFLPGFDGTKEEGLRLIVDKQLSPSVLGRSAYCEKKLLDEIATGCGQYLTHSSQTKKGIKCTHYHIFVTRIGFRLEQGIEIVPSKL